jgi:hypothetical protein
LPQVERAAHDEEETARQHGLGSVLVGLYAYQRCQGLRLFARAFRGF